MLILAGKGVDFETISSYLKSIGEETRYIHTTEISSEILEDAEGLILFGDDHKELLSIKDELIRQIPMVLCIVSGEEKEGFLSLDKLFTKGLLEHITELREKNKSNELLETVKSCKRLHILVHDDPDPDALASSMALEAICKQAGVDSRVYYGGEIGYKENELFLECTDLDIEGIKNQDEGTLYGSEIAFVDFARVGENNSLPEGVRAKIIIDHHYTNKDVSEGDYVEVENIGATSTLMTEHLKNLDIPISSKLATALLYGIKVDTMGYSRNISQRDLMALGFLTPFVDNEIMYILDSTPMDPDTVDTLGTAISNRKIVDGVMTAFAGYVNQRDDIPQVADILEGERDISMVMVMGIFQDHVHMSARSKDPKLNLGSIMKELYKDIGSSGGHMHSAGGKISLSRFPSDEEAIKEISKRFLEGVKR